MGVCGYGCGGQCLEQVPDSEGEGSAPSLSGDTASLCWAWSAVRPRWPSRCSPRCTEEPLGFLRDDPPNLGWGALERPLDALSGAVGGRPNLESLKLCLAQWPARTSPYWAGCSRMTMDALYAEREARP